MTGDGNFSLIFKKQPTSSELSYNSKSEHIISGLSDKKLTELFFFFFLIKVVKSKSQIFLCQTSALRRISSCESQGKYCKCNSMLFFINRLLTREFFLVISNMLDPGIYKTSSAQFLFKT